MRLNFLKFLDKYAGLVICFFLTLLNRLSGRGETVLRREEVKKTLAMKFWGLGSILLLTPAMKEFRKTYPDSKLVFLTLSWNREICESLKLFDDVITVNLDEGWFGFAKTFMNAVLYFWRQRFDMVIDFEFFTRFSSIVTFLTFAKIKVGYHAWETWRGDIHNIQVPFNRYWHVMDNFYNLGVHIGFPERKQLTMAKPFVSPQDMAVVKKLLGEAGVKDGYIAVNVNAGDLCPERRWPRGNFISLVGRLIEKYGPGVVFIGSRSDREYVQGTLDAVGRAQAVNFAGKLSITQLAALLANAKLFISNDSGPLHLAVAMETPTISFFGPETPVFYGSPDEKHAVFFKNIECSPCINVHDRKSVRCYWSKPKCMEAITVDEVFKVIETKLLAQ